LLERLKEFGSSEEKAKKVLICLTSSQGKKARKSFSELKLSTGIEVEGLKSVMKKMIDMRMARAAGENEFEIIHDYLARVVGKELVQEEDRNVKFLQEQLESYQQIYAAHKAPIMSTPFLANLYRNRVKVKISEEKYPLILCTCLLKENGLGWYWLKDIEKSQMLEMLKTHISHGKEDIREEAVNGFVSLATREDKENILDMLTNEDGRVRLAAVKALGKIATPEDREKVIEMMKDKNSDVRKLAVKAFLKKSTLRDSEKIIDMLTTEENISVRHKAVKALGKIAITENRGKIINMLTDEDKYVRQAAVKALEKITTREDREKNIEIVKNKIYHVKQKLANVSVYIATLQDKEKIIKMLKNKYIPGYARQVAKEAFVKIATLEDRQMIINMLKDEDYYGKQSAAKAFVKIATPEDWEKIIEMMKDEDIYVKRAGVYAFLKISEPGDREKLLDPLSEQCQGWSEDQMEIFKLLSEVDKRLYCPFYEEEKEEIPWEIL
jgi:HEAT repeat protein